MKERGEDENGESVMRNIERTAACVCLDEIKTGRHDYYIN